MKRHFISLVSVVLVSLNFVYAGKDQNQRNQDSGSNQDTAAYMCEGNKLEEVVFSGYPPHLKSTSFIEYVNAESCDEVGTVELSSGGSVDVNGDLIPWTHGHYTNVSGDVISARPDTIGCDLREFGYNFVLPSPGDNSGQYDKFFKRKFRCPYSSGEEMPDYAAPGEPVCVGMKFPLPVDDRLKAKLLRCEEYLKYTNSVTGLKRCDTPEESDGTKYFYPYEFNCYGHASSFFIGGRVTNSAFDKFLKSYCTSKNISELQIGDVVLFNGHAGVISALPADVSLRSKDTIIVYGKEGNSGIYEGPVRSWQTEPTLFGGAEETYYRCETVEDKKMRCENETPSCKTYLPDASQYASWCSGNVTISPAHLTPGVEVTMSFSSGGYCRPSHVSLPFAISAEFEGKSLVASSGQYIYGYDNPPLITAKGMAYSLGQYEMPPFPGSRSFEVKFKMPTELPTVYFEEGSNAGPYAIVSGSYPGSSGWSTLAPVTVCSSASSTSTSN